MPALPNRHGVELAVRAPGVPTVELGAVGGRLDNMTDVHFGINNDNFNPLLFGQAPNLMGDLEGLGPRILDIINRGGRTAEDTWEKLVVDPSRDRTRAPTPNFQEFFDRFNEDKIVRNDLYPDGALQSGKRVAGKRRYARSGVNKLQGLNFRGRHRGLQYGTRWSKTALEHARQHNGHIHFHLDGMGDLSLVLTKRGNFSHNVTSRELRYVFRNWQEFHRCTTFYNGYDRTNNRAIAVEPPWLYWRPDLSTNRCQMCNSWFRIGRGKHHCRKCGRIFCQRCSSHRKELATPVKRPRHPREIGPVRVCDRCYQQN